ncbi:hypothetical protein BCE_4979 [Bacillus cereus ATCC 10987]|uniref:Uncharacterized protein n=1 Tax=Bacillus cereus (strain ATCC 10987 / NRS 248) TaxID=222523 RepID=Q72YP2_BACC1|nr:hypothetical protein BCE_4979 [Bacillus cereus ATCC 10987]
MVNCAQMFQCVLQSLFTIMVGSFFFIAAATDWKNS